MSFERLSPQGTMTGGATPGSFDATDPDAVAAARLRCAAALRKSTAVLAAVDPGVELELIAIDRAQAAAPERPLELRGWIGEGELRIQTDQRLAGTLMAHLPEPESLATLSATDAALIVEHLLSDSFAAIEQALGTTAEFARAGQPPRPAGSAAFAFEAITETGRFPLLVEIDDPAVMLRIAERLEPFAAPDGGDAAAPRQLSVIIGPVLIAAEDVAELGPGDQIVLDEARGDHVRGVIADERGALFEITVKGAQATLVEPVEAGETIEAGLVALGFRYGRRDLSARDLRQLGRGSVLDFNKVGGNAVEIVAGSEVVGAGELMRIDGAIGVRVTDVQS